MRKNHHVFRSAFLCALTVFSVYVLLDTFVIVRRIKTSAEARTDSEPAGYTQTGQAAVTSRLSAAAEAVTDTEAVRTEDTYRDENISITVTEERVGGTSVYLADVELSSAEYLKTAFAENTYGRNVTDKTSSIAESVNAILAVNGSYNQGLVIRSGELLQRLRANKGWNSDSACIIYKNGTMKTFRLKKEPLNPKEEIKNGAWFGWQFGPILIRDYEPFAGATAHGELGYKARNMLGYYEPGHYVIVNCDAYRDDAKGMTAQMMVDLMKSLGVKDAFNLDGGTSAVMVFMGEVINRPTPRIENGKKVPGRPLLDMLLFAEYDENGVAPDLSTLQADKFMNKN